MAKFVAVVGMGSDYGQPTDHIFERIVQGDIDSVRERLVLALKNLGYGVVNEQPLIVKRPGQVSSCSFDVLKCVKRLSIGLSSVNPTSTQVTFDYQICNSFVTKGDRQTTEREADAIIALAEAFSEPPVCVRCGTSNSRDSHFCRVCGAPTTIAEPPELEVLRLTSGARPAHQFIVLGFVSALFITVLSMYLILFSGKTPKVGLTVLAVGETLAACCFLYGIWRLHRTLNPKSEASEALSSAEPLLLKQATTAALPPQSAGASVTEGTTELLGPRERERIAVPANSHEIDTAEIR